MVTHMMPNAKVVEKQSQYPLTDCCRLSFEKVEVESWLSSALAPHCHHAILRNTAQRCLCLAYL
jgi:hypothetical protein